MRSRQTGSGFTLIELLVVIAIIGVLASFLLPAVSRAKWTAKKTQCISNLSQIAKSVAMYRNYYGDEPPPWLSNLYPNFLDTEKVFLCPCDPKKGKDGGKPYWEKDKEKAYIETDDFNGSDAGTKDPGAAAAQNPDIEGNSYLYEFCIAKCFWYGESYSWNDHTATMDKVNVIPDTVHDKNGVGTVTWREIKEWEKVHVGAWTPLVRCFWHTSGSFVGDDIVINVASGDHHVYISGTGADDWKIDGVK